MHGGVHILVTSPGRDRDGGGRGHEGQDVRRVRGHPLKIDKAVAVPSVGEDQVLVKVITTGPQHSTPSTLTIGPACSKPPTHRSRSVSALFPSPCLQLFRLDRSTEFFSNLTS